MTATSTTVQSTTTCAEEVCKIVGSGDGSPENAQESSKVDASKQAEVIEPAEEAVEAVNKQTQDPAEGCSNCTVFRPVTRILCGGGGGVLTRPKWTKLPKCIFYLIFFNWRPVNFSFFFFIFFNFNLFIFFNFIIFFKWRLVSSTQELILVTLFILRPVSSS